MLSASDCADLDDAALARAVAQAPAGEGREAEAELCRRFARRVRLYGLRHLRDSHAAADLAQHVLLTMIESLRAGKIRDPGQIASFVLGTCRMVALDLRRTSARRSRLLETFGGDDEEAPPPQLTLDHDRLRECLERLPENERSVLVMSFYDDQPAAVIARELALSEGNVRVIRHRGLRRLRTCMDPRGAS
ncbi:MAG TPA: sigma-70 family RNA polymerase sigma factor [Casimicrobiaceae bacterium]|nr:sigma-70 family RNA polymerase sigma factor [Casimicrobiaceae bacterium]